MFHVFKAAVLMISISALTGCGVLIGNVKPIEEKSESYRILDLTRQNPDWSRLNPQGGVDGSADKTQNAAADLAYQSTRTSSIVSLNSACRHARQGGEHESLREFSRLLFLGMTDITEREEHNAEVAAFPALETTVEGRLNGERMKLRAVVVRKSDCIYDLMYVARPEHFDDQVEDFTQFVSSLKLK